MTAVGMVHGEAISVEVRAASLVAGGGRNTGRVGSLWSLWSTTTSINALNSA